MTSFKREGYNEDTGWQGAAIVKGWRGVAWHVLGMHTVPDEDTEWSGYEVEDGKLLCVMVGDDRPFLFDPSEVIPLAREEYCGECGQIGCPHDGLDRSE